MKEFNVGDYVKVVNVNNTFSHYTKWLHDHELTGSCWEYGYAPSNNDKGTILFKGVLSKSDSRTLYFVISEDKEHTYIISGEGIQLIQGNKVDTKELDINTVGNPPQTEYHTHTNGYNLVRKTSNVSNNNTIKSEETIMNNTQRATVTVELFDDSKGLPVEHSLVASYSDIVTEDDSTTTIQNILLTKDVKGKIDKHNKKRAEIVNLDIEERTGQSVMLKPVELKQLRWNVK